MLGELYWPDLDRFRKDMDELFDRFFGQHGYRTPAGTLPAWTSSDFYLKDGSWVMRFDLPGVDPKDIDISVAGDTLTIQASREQQIDRSGHGSSARGVSYGRFEHSVVLPKGAETEKMKANYRHGVLELTMPASSELAGRKIPVEIGTDEKKQIEHKAE